MSNPIEAILSDLETGGNLRRLPADRTGNNLIDLSSNDYLGIAADGTLMESFLAGTPDKELSSSASRLLGASQKIYESFENTLADAYGRPALTFNSGYHANVGMLGALAAVPGTVFIADKLVHASIIDGMAGGRMSRFRHNDLCHAETLAKKALADTSVKMIVIVAESVYSMDGDRADIAGLVSLKRSLASHVPVLLYLDEAHALGILGPAGLGLGKEYIADTDIIVGTLGKALASVGAFASCSGLLRDFFINRARSLIFSTALPPLNVAWSDYVFRAAMGMDSRRAHLATLGQKLSHILRNTSGSHIQPLIVGDAHRAVALSQHLRRGGYVVLPIRRPTVPPGTERLRFSLGANLTLDSLNALPDLLNGI